MAGYRYKLIYEGTDEREYTNAESNSLEEINTIAQYWAYEIYEDYFLSEQQKYDILDSADVVDTETGQSALSAESEEYIDSKMSELDSRLVNEFYNSLQS